MFWKRLRHRNRRTTAARWGIISLQITALMVHNVVALAGPTDGVVVGGSASISAGGGVTNINQTSSRAIVNWGGFSIGQGESVNFSMPNSQAAILNRVVGSDPSAIMGQLNANGKVFLINPNGIVIGATGQINVGSFIASTLDVGSSKFMEGGDLNFIGDSAAEIQNHGTINAIDGDVYMIAASVSNHGNISALSGTVGLAAGQDVLLVDSGSPHLKVRPTSRSLGGTGIHNTGSIQAMQAELMAAGGNVYALAINNEGTIRANGAATVGGRVYLVSDGGRIRSSGDLIAKRGENGGDVIVSAGGQEGSSVELSGVVDVSGKDTGGTVFVKGQNINLSRATVHLDAATRGTLFLSMGPHSANLLDPNDNPPYLNFTSDSGQTEVIDNSGVVAISSPNGSATLDGNGTTVQGDPGFDGFLIESADPDNPYLQEITFNLDGAPGNLDEANSFVTFEITTREPDGTFMTSTTTLSLADYKTAFGGANDTRVRILATGGELIQSIKITSTGVTNKGDVVDNPISQIKQLDEAVAAAPTIITVQKQTTPDGDPTIFDFEIRHNPTTALEAEFGLADGNEFSVVLTPDTYDVLELAEAGWFLTSIDHSVANSDAGDQSSLDSMVNVDLANRLATVDLAKSETVTLVFTNTQGGTIVVTKVANGPDGAATAFDFELDDSGGMLVQSFDLGGGESESFILMPGTYTVEELAELGWFFDGISGADSVAGQTGTVTIAAGETAELVFTNTQGGQIIVTKNVNAGDTSTLFDFSAAGGDLADSSFQLADGDSITLDSNEQSGYLRPGTYTIEELAELGWFFDGVDGADAIDGREGTVHLAAGEVVNLTFHNTQGAQLLVTKNAIGRDGASTEFDFESSGGPSTIAQSTFTLDGGETITLDSTEQAGYVRPGTYTIEELAELGWFFDGVAGADSVDGQAATVTVGAGGTAELIFTNTQGAQIILTKNAIGPDGATTDFDFESSGGPSTIVPGSGSLKGGQSVTLDSTEQADYVRPGTYTIEELAELGWFFDGVTGADSVDGQAATVTVGAGETAELVFTNTQGAQIIVTKNAAGPDGDSTEFDFEASGGPSTLAPGSFTLNGGDSITLDSTEQTGYVRPGTYTIEELAELGWFFEDVTGADAVNGQAATVTVSPGEVATLTFYNVQGSVLTVKKVANGPDGSATTFDFELAESGGGVNQSFTLTGGDSESATLRPGTYTVEELAELGWFFDGITGADTVSGQTGTVTLSPGEAATMTFHNTQGGQIIVNKNVNAGDSSVPFDFTAAGGDLADTSFQLSGGDSITLDSNEQAGYLRPGTYTIEELSELGWFFDGIDGADSFAGREGTVHLQAGEVVDLTFHNTQGAQLVVTKVVSNGDTNTVFDFQAGGNDLAATEFQLADGQSATLGSNELTGYLRPGIYTVEELQQLGWTLEGVSGADQLIDQTAGIRLTAGEVAELTFRNKFTPPPKPVQRPEFFLWEPIYPDGNGLGMMFYGAAAPREEDEITGESSFDAFNWLLPAFPLGWQPPELPEKVTGTP